MNKFIKGILILTAIWLVIFSADIVEAQSNSLDLKLESQPWGVIYGGGTYTADLEVTNNTGKILDGVAIFDVKYENKSFDGEGIQSYFRIRENENWLSSDWQGGKATFIGFQIPKGKNEFELKMETHPALAPGEYSFAFSIKGITEEKEYTTLPIVIGGGGGGYIPTAPTIPTTDTGKVIATPTEGGITTLINPDGSQIKLIIPQGAVSENTRFTIERVDIDLVNQPNSESGLFLVNGLVYEIKAERDGVFITTFSKLLTLIFTYTDEQIEGLNETSLKIYYWDNIQNQWIALENSKVDVEHNTVTVPVDHFFLFALMGSKIEFTKEEEFKEEEKPFPITPGEKIKEKTAEKPVGGSPITAEEPGPAEIAPEDGKASAVGEKTLIGAPSKGLTSMVAAIGMIWGEISKSTFLTIVIILCLIGLVLIGIREWRIFRKKERNIES